MAEVNRRRGSVSVPIEGETFRDAVDAWKKDVAPCTVATISEPSKIVCREHAELPDISVRLDFGLDTNPGNNEERQTLEQSPKRGREPNQQQRRSAKLGN